MNKSIFIPIAMAAGLFCSSGAVLSAADSFPEGFAFISGGIYQRGDAFGESEVFMESSRPAHEVEVSGFYIATTPVTYEVWTAVYEWAIDNGYRFDRAGTGGWYPGGGGRPGPDERGGHPVVNVNWYDAVKWCNARSEKEGRRPAYYLDEAHEEIYRAGRYPLGPLEVDWDADGYRLPTEAEWEKAARGGIAGGRWAWGNAPIGESKANYTVFDDAAGTSVPGSYPTNGYGLYDMAGNVHEWCWDWFEEAWYESDAARDPDTRGPLRGTTRVARGGSWSSFAAHLRVAIRFENLPAATFVNHGFRLAVSDTP